jgi:16S rRNA (cytidine1402-2'-O)-methyltransferase
MGQGAAVENAAQPVGTLAPGLYVTATPIGNASDVTLRALSVLKDCDAIVAEDTRVTSRLLALHGISRPLLTYNDHNAPAMRPKLLQRLKTGGRLALVSDAGTPLISDPGHKLVRDARAAGIAVYPIPGPSAAIAALSAAGLPTDRFLFAGFLPSKAGERRTALSELRSMRATLIFYESPNRLADSLSDMADVFGAREAAVGRELTKLHEEIRTGTPDELAAHYAESPPKGEITILVAAAAEEESDVDPARVDRLLRMALPFMPVNAAASLVAEATGEARRTVYARALALKAAGEDSGDAGS